MKVTTRNNHVKNPQQAAKKATGRRIAQLEKELKSLDEFDNATKTRMHDRMKFMSAKNARLKEARLDQIDKNQEAIKAELSELQQL